MKIITAFLNWFRHGLISLMMVGISTLVLGMLITVFDPFQLLLNWKIAFSQGDETFELWRKPEANVYLKVYIFNITNHIEFLSGKDKKLRYQEVGPYVYREIMEHKINTFSTNNTLTITPVYYPVEWVPELNTGKEDDVFILPNVPFFCFANLMSDTSMITRMGVNLLIRQAKLQPFTRQTAKEFLFGYDSSLVTIGNKIIPSWIDFDKLGLIDRMYNFKGDSATVYTGGDDASKSGTIENYNRRPYLPQWPSAPCNQVTGSSDGTKFPSMKPEDTTMFFRKSMCRAMPMERTSELMIHDGLPVYKYIFKDGTLDNGADNPENKCFCRNNKCLKPGLIDVMDCYYGFPIVLSYPHFYKADQSLLDAVEGLNPDQKQHETYFLINPETGIPTQVYVRVQANINLGDLSNVANTECCSNMVIPLIWTEIGLEKLPDNVLLRFFLYLRVAPVVLFVLKYALLIGGLAFVALAVIASVYVPDKEKLKYRNSGTWRRDSQTLARTQTIRVPVPAAATAANEMNTYYSSLRDAGSSCCTDPEFDDDDDDDYCNRPIV